MAPPLPVLVTVINKRLHKRDDYNSPNLSVLIPVIIILTIVAVAFFGWLGLPWPKIMAWWKRKRSRSTTTPKDDDLHDQELDDRRPSNASTVKARAEPEPGSGLSYAKAFERSHIDALKLSNIGGDNERRGSKSKNKDNKNLRKSVDRALGGEASTQSAPRASGDTRLSGTLTPDLASGQMTPGQQSTLSAVPERRASPWDPTRMKD